VSPAAHWLPALLGLIGLQLLLFVGTHLVVRRYGGWRAVRRAVVREIDLTAEAFAEPFRARARRRRNLRTLTGLLSDPAGWAVAERAMRRAEAAAPGVAAYAALLGADVVGVLVCGGAGEPPRPGPPWVVDERDPLRWWIDRVDVTGAAENAPAPASRRAPPLLVTLGVHFEHDELVVLLDLVRGPAAVQVGGDPHAARAVLQTITAQLDVRCPPGTVTVAAGVHDRHPGGAPDAALAAARARATPGRPAFAVCATAPRPPGGHARLLAGDGVRGTARLIETARNGGVLVHGTPLCADASVLPAAVKTILSGLPPYPTPRDPADDLTEPALATPFRTARTVPETPALVTAAASADHGGARRES